MPDEQQKIRDVVSLAYAAAAGRAEWATFLEAYRVASSSAVATFNRWTRATGANILVALTGDGSNEAIREYATYYGAINPHFNRFPELNVPGNINLGHRRVPVSDLVRTEYYADYCRRFHIESVMGACISEDAGETTHLCVLRPFQVGLYHEPDERRARLLMPHARRAIHLGSRLATLRTSHGAHAAALDGIADGVLVVDSKGHVLFANRAAAQMFARRVLRQSASGVETWDAALTARLRSALRQVAVSAREPQTAPPPAMVMPDMEGEATYRVSIMPGTPLQDASSRHVGVATIVVTERSPSGGTAALAARYGLTSREEEVAACLAQGLATREIAVKLSIGVETVRTHVKHVLRKTNHSRVTSLVREWSRPPSA